MKKHLLFFLLLVTSSIFGQGSKDRILYLDSLEQPASEEKHDFFRIMKNFYSTDSQCAVYDYYKSGKLKMTGTLYDKYLLRKTGPFVSYYENGSRESIIQYQEDNPIGKGYLWYEKGLKKAEVEFLKADPGEDPVMKINQYWSRIAIQRVIDGKGHFHDEDITSESEGELKNGLKDGEWYGTDYRGKFTFTEIYKKGKLLSGISTDSVQQKHPYKTVYIPPRPIKGIEDFYDHFVQKLRYYEKNSTAKIYSTIAVGFQVDILGKIKYITILHDVKGDIKRNIMSIFDSYAGWLPAEMRGIKTEMSMVVPVYVKLH